MSSAKIVFVAACFALLSGFAYDKSLHGLAMAAGVMAFVCVFGAWMNFLENKV